MNKSQIAKQIAQDNRFLVSRGGRLPLYVSLAPATGWPGWVATLLEDGGDGGAGATFNVSSRDVDESAAAYEERAAQNEMARAEKLQREQEQQAARAAAAAAVPERLKQAFAHWAETAESAYERDCANVAERAAKGDWDGVALASEAMANTAGRLDAVRRIAAALDDGGVPAARRAMLHVLMMGHGITHMGAREIAEQEFRSGRVAMAIRIDTMLDIVAAE